MPEKKERSHLYKPLTVSEMRFCELVAQGDTYADAWRKSGHSDNAHNASVALRRPDVKAYLDKCRRKVESQVEKKIVRTATSVVELNWTIAEANVADFMKFDPKIERWVWKTPDEWGILAPLVEKVKFDPETGAISEIKLVAKDSAIDRLHRVYGLFEKDNRKVVEIRSGPVQGVRTAEEIRQLPTEELKRIVASAEEKIEDAESEVVENKSD